MNIESVIEKCKALKLKAIADHLEQTTALTEHRNWTPLHMIDHLFELELQLRKKTRSSAALNNPNSMKKQPSTSSILPFTAHAKIRRAEL